ncbi:MAG TPA: GntR family transcriptional regulator [Vicinamibacterales bacterium]|nr:GntR family transcriptional regulator [Vicinamibacterales bacterium]
MSPPSRKLTLPPISPSADGPLYQQIVDGLKREVSEGRLPPGAALPSFRGLAEELLVSVITVKRAYEELERDGIIFCRQGLGTFVANAAPDRTRAVKTERARDLLREAVREAFEAGLTGKDVVRQLQTILHEESEPKHVRKRG